MENYKAFSSSLLLALLFLSCNPAAVTCRNPSRAAATAAGGDKLQTYIIHVQPPEGDALAATGGLESWYQSFLPETTAGSSESRIVFAYGEVFSGFAARLTAAEVEGMKKKVGFVRAYPDRLLPLLTTHTPDFLGLKLGTGLWNASGLGGGVIVGLLDTGVLPGHPSFDDDGVPPPPAKWKGSCGSVKGCNNKLIGVKSFTGDGALDEVGHGTHTASTAAGNFVKGVSFLGLANGTAAGIAPHAHLAIYKVCNDIGCKISAILAGLDAAVKDGVDVASLSLGGGSQPLDRDTLAIGAFGAMAKGIVVVCAAGNDGPETATLSNEAPWILTVAASTVDRSLRSTVTLGNGREFYGETLSQAPNATSAKLPLTFSNSAGDCTAFSSAEDYKGKVAVCLLNASVGVSETQIGRIGKEAGVAGMILVSPDEHGYTLFDKLQVLPTSTVVPDDGSEIVLYAGTEVDPIASITYDGTVLGVSPAPVVAFFSSRGPSTATPGILKPDITGPGVNIIAAWPVDPVGTKNDAKTFNIISGTSMATPHLSGISALVKSVHPDWSPAAIKSAIMTTSDTEDRNGTHILDHLHKNASFFAMGAGHVNPTRAADPGLVYDLGIDDYVRYLCGLGFGDSGVGAIVRRRNFSCSAVGSITEAELNYPSILVTAGSDTVTVNRTVTNVGERNSTYKVEVDVPNGVSVVVEPKTLTFSEVNQKKSFTVAVSWSISAEGAFAEGNLRWVSDDHVVRSPIVVSSGSAS